MAAIDVTELPNFGYPESTRFLDPVDPRFEAKPWTGTNLNHVTSVTLPAFSSLDAYASVAAVDAALTSFYAGP